MGKATKVASKKDKALARELDFGKPQGVPEARRIREKDDRRMIPVRLSQKDWERLKIFAIQERTTVQALALRGFSMQLVEKGLPGLAD